MNSETSVCRARLERFCGGEGLDLGCGGDLIVPQAIGVDLPSPYTRVGNLPIHLRGDARNLHWFADGCLDFVFASHLLEDFPAHETGLILREWSRVLRRNGHLVIYGPDEQVYRAHCEKTGQPQNGSHSVDDFGAAFVARLIESIPGLRIIHRTEHCDAYGFELVARKEIV